MTWQLTQKAEEDLINIYLEGAEQFGTFHAEAYLSALETRFQFLAEHPLAAPERKEIQPPVRIHPFRSHLIIYQLDAQNHPLILRVRHCREDWQSPPHDPATTAP